MQGKVILTNEEILNAANHYHSNKEATQQRTAIQNANAEKWDKYLSLQTKESQILLIETKAYLDSLVAEKWKALKYLEINNASEQVITRMKKLLNYDVEVAFTILESAHSRAISESGATELVDSLSTFYGKINLGIRPRIKGFLNYLSDTMAVTYNLDADNLDGHLAKYVLIEEKKQIEINRKLREVSPAPKAEGNNGKVKIKTIDKLSKEDIEIRDHFRIAKGICREQTKALHYTLKTMGITKDDMVLYKREINRVRMKLERIGEWKKKTTTKLQSI